MTIGYVYLSVVKHKKLFAQGDNVFIGQITDPKTLDGVASDIDWIFCTVGITRQKDGLTYMHVDYQGNTNLLAEVKKEKNYRFSIHLSH